MQDPNFNPSSVPVRYSNNSSGNIFSTIALILSVFSLLASGFTAFQVLSLRQAIGTTSTQIGAATVPDAASTPPATANTGSAATTPPVNAATAPSPTSNSAPAASAPAATIQPGQFVSSAFNNIAEVELIKVSRDAQNANAVNVLARVRLLDPEKAAITDSIYMNNTKARNSQGSEVYEAIREGDVSSANLFLMRPAPTRPDEQNSADVSVKLAVPADVNTIDIYIPETEAFTNVPISPG